MVDEIKTDIWMPIYWPDWVRDTAQLSLQEQGAYLILTKEYWNKQGKLCDDKTRLYRSCGAQSRSEKESVNFILDTYFLHENGMYINKRIDEELVKAAENKVTQRKRTEAARAAKLKKTKTVTTPVTSSPSPTPTPKKEIDKESISNTNAQFDTFWKAYPRKKSKDAAKKRFIKVMDSGVELKEIMDGLKILSKTLTNTEIKFIPHAATWLHEKRWNDEDETGTIIGGEHHGKQTNSYTDAAKRIIADRNKSPQ